MRFACFFAAVFILATVVFGGTVEGEVIYSGTMTGTIVIGFLPEGATGFDPLTDPFTTLSAPGEYSLSDDSFVDGVDFYGMAFMGTGYPIPMPASGNPAGMTPEPVVLTGGIATDVDITLEESGTIGGNIIYAGDIHQICVEVWDKFPEFLGGSAELEGTFCVGDTVYELNDIPAGAKSVKAFADINGNDLFDDGEPIGVYDGPFGELIFVGGGGLSESEVDITIPGTIVAEKTTPEEFAIYVSPNPFNASCYIESPGAVEIFDISGRLVKALPNAGRWNGTDENGNILPSGSYLARVTYKGVSKTTTLLLMK